MGLSLDVSVAVTLNVRKMCKCLSSHKFFNMGVGLVISTVNIEAGIMATNCSLTFTWKVGSWKQYTQQGYS